MCAVFFKTPAKYKYNSYLNSIFSITLCGIFLSLINLLRRSVYTIHNIFEFFPSNCIFWQLKLYIHLENDTGGAIWGKTNDLSQIVTLKIYWWSMEKGHWCISFYKSFLVYYILVLLSNSYIPFFPPYLSTTLVLKECCLLTFFLKLRRNNDAIDGLKWFLYPTMTIFCVYVFENNPWYDTRTKILNILKKLLDKSNVSVF